MIDSRLKDAFASFFSPKYAIPFLIGVVVQGVLVNAVYQFLTNLLGTQNSSLIVVAVVTVAGFFLTMFVFLWQARRPLGIPLLDNPRRPAQRRGLIFLFSRDEPCEVAVRYHHPKLKRLWLICSPQTNDAAIQAARELNDKYQVQAEVRLISNVHDPMECYRCVRDVYTTLPKDWSVNDVIGDYTGMTAHASIGMTLACLNLGAPLQYIPARFTDPTQPPVGSDLPFEIVLKGRRPEPTKSTSPKA